MATLSALSKHRRLTSDDQVDIRATVNAVLEHVGVAADEIPRDLDKVLRGLGLIARRKDFTKFEQMLGVEADSIQGAVVAKNDLPLLLYRPSVSRSAIRNFTSHELGHSILHADHIQNGRLTIKSKTNDSQDDDNRQMEDEADEFADELLMPEERLKKDISLKAFSEDEDERADEYVRLAQMYVVPYSSMKKRAIKLVDEQIKKASGGE